jgi:hypothetical protein
MRRSHGHRPETEELRLPSRKQGAHLEDGKIPNRGEVVGAADVGGRTSTGFSLCFEKVSSPSQTDRGRASARRITLPQRASAREPVSELAACRRP